VADIFISYSQLDAARVTPLAARLASLGYSVWRDDPERKRPASIGERERELEAARAVLAVWSASARDASHVQAEAALALDHSKLMQLKLDPITPPAPFDTLPAADLTGAAAWGPLEQALAQLVRKGEAAEPAARTSVGPMSTVTAAGAPKLITFAMATTLAAFAGALSASVNGAMSPDQMQIALIGVLGVALVCAVLCAQRIYAISRAGG
jgi:hypothetical protein